MKVAMLTTRKTSKSTIDAHIRDAQVLERELGWDLIMGTSRLYFERFGKQALLKAALNKYDAIIVLYWSGHFFVKPYLRMIDDLPAARLFWFTNEYDLTLPSEFLKLFKARGFEIISNYTENGSRTKGFDKYHCLNLNVLLAREANKLHKKSIPIIYYGTFRKDRLDYMQKYLQGGVALSANPRNFKKFKHAGCAPEQWIGKLDWRANRETLNLCEISLYIEDKFTHRCYNHLANRFYEALTCNCLVVFDANCQFTLDHVQLTGVEDYIVSSHDELLKMHAKLTKTERTFKQHLKRQHMWLNNALAERKLVLRRLKDIVERSSHESGV